MVGDMESRRIIVGLGEALFDIYPDEARLGGAPLNLAVHAHQLGNLGTVASRIGHDERGGQILDELRRRGMPVDAVQTDPDLPTGTVRVELDERGEPSYTIVQGVAWDALQWDPDLESLARRCEAVGFGSLAQRDSRSRSTIQRFLEAARSAVRLFDVNLRQHYHDRRIIERSLELATAVKLNGGELETLRRMFGLGATADEAAARMRERHGLKFVAVTRGARGMAVHTSAGMIEGQPVALSGPLDAVGAGDSAAAALLHGAVRQWPWERTIALANAVGAHVASQRGACPPLSEKIMDMAR
jgi:fructokinase